MAASTTKENKQNWRPIALRHAATMKSGEAITSESIEAEGRFPVYGGNGVRGFCENFTHDGEYVLIGRQGAYCGNVHHVKGRFWASEHAIVAELHGKSHVKWFYYLFQSLSLSQYSISAAQPGLAIERIKSLMVEVPPFKHQESIANFLDHKTGAIDTLIAKKERLLALLEEKRQAVVTQAVTKGLYPNVSYKETAEIFLNSIPAHWSVSRLKFLQTVPFMYGANETAEDDDPLNPRFIRITDINPDGQLDDSTFRSLQPDVAARYMLSDGDILLARSGATVGKSFLYKKTYGHACFAGYLIRFRADTSLVDPDFVRFYTDSYPYWQFIAQSTIQATIQNVSAEKYGSFFMPVPPLQEQYDIVRQLTSMTSKHREVKRAIECHVAKLREYRQALISAAVTGQIDVAERIAGEAQAV